MKILVTGATGFVGRKLITQLTLEGHDIVVLSRDARTAKQKISTPVSAFSWDPQTGLPPAEAFLGVQGVIHLAGEGIAEKRWTRTQKEKVYGSRVTGTQNLMEAIAKLPGAKPAVVVSASAIGFYGSRGDEILTETSKPGTGFLPDVCREWEQALFGHPIPGVRLAALRIGIVLGREGGMIKKVLPLFKTGLAGPLGNGRQYMSWIHVDDLVGLLMHALKTPSVQGPMNAVAPNPVTNAYFTTTIGRALSRPAFLPAPAFALKLALGELSELLLGSQRVTADLAEKSGYRFLFNRLDEALSDLCKKKSGQPLEELRADQWLPVPIDKVFAYFSDEKNLEALTPPWLHFKVLRKSTPRMQAGTLIDYELRLHGLRLRWQSSIDQWQPGREFVDQQVKGPYRWWHHTHTFEAVGGGTLVRDRVEYLVPGGWLGDLVAGAWVRKDLHRIFTYRQEAIAKAFV